MDFCPILFCFIFCIFFFFFFIWVLWPVKINSPFSNAIVRWGKNEGPRRKPSDHLQAELGLSHVTQAWLEPTKVRSQKVKRFRDSGFNHSDTGATCPLLGQSLNYTCDKTICKTVILSLIINLKVDQKHIHGGRCWSHFESTQDMYVLTFLLISLSQTGHFVAFSAHSSQREWCVQGRNRMFLSLILHSEHFRTFLKLLFSIVTNKGSEKDIILKIRFGLQHFDR